MIRFVKPTTLLALSISASLPISSFATNGMNLEGYGPVALGMGGASQAYDNGTAATMNNPATLGMMKTTNRFDIALGLLGPNVTSSMEGMPDAYSSGDAYYMPAVGYVRKTGIFSYGFGLFSQGGMGTEYSGDTFLAAGSGKTVRSELGVGRFVLPLNFAVTKNFNIALSADFVWAGLDLQMALSGSQFGDMTSAGSQSQGTASGSTLTTFQGFVGNGTIQAPPNSINWARFDFSNSNAFTGEAKSTGYAGKLGFTYTFNSMISIGGMYHSKTSLGDMETSKGTMTMNANVDDGARAVPPGAPVGSYTAVSMALPGKVTVKDFQWPATYGLGAAITPMKNLMVVLDLKRIQWSDVMESFDMNFKVDSGQQGLLQPFSDTEVDMSLFQKWKDQTVVQLGAAWGVARAVTVRGGYNYAQNPVPDQYLNPLFPAIVEHHLTAGVGYLINKKGSALDFALSYGFNSSATNPQTDPANPDSAVTVDHSQLSWQIMYSNQF